MAAAQGPLRWGKNSLQVNSLNNPLNLFSKTRVRPACYISWVLVRCCGIAYCLIEGMRLCCTVLNVWVGGVMLAYYILFGVDRFAEHLQQWYETQFPSVMLISGLPEACSFPSRPSKTVCRWRAETECIPPPHHLQLQPVSSVGLHHAHKSLDNCLFEFNKLFTHVNGIFPAVWAPPWNFISSSSPHPWLHCEPPVKYLRHNPIFAWASSYSLSMFILLGH